MSKQSVTVCAVFTLRAHSVRDLFTHAFVVQGIHGGLESLHVR